MTALVAAGVWAVAELFWAAIPALRPHRLQLRFQHGLFFLVVAAIYSGTVLGVIPERFHYGSGVMRYASDSLTYRQQGQAIASDLRGGSPPGIWDPQKFLYSKLLGVVFAATGDSGLAAMLINAVFYSATLGCVFLIANEIFGAWVASRAMAIAAVWPGFLLHEVQTLRLVGTTLGLELVVLGCVLLIRRGMYAPALIAPVIGYALLLTDQPYVARLLCVVTGAFSVWLGVVAWRRRTRWQPAAALMMLALAMYVVFQAMWADSASRSVELATSEFARAGGGGRASIEMPAVIRRVWERIEGNLVLIALARNGYEIANLARPDGTLSATPPPLMSPGALVANFPAAIVSAALAPLPSAILSERRGVSNLRKFVLIELIPYYLLLPCAGLAAWFVLRARGVPGDQAAFVFVLILAAYAILGTVVVNDGTLYRFRQPYVLLQIIFAVEGCRYLAAAIRRSPAPSGSSAVQQSGATSR